MTQNNCPQTLEKQLKVEQKEVVTECVQKVQSSTLEEVTKSLQQATRLKQEGNEVFKKNQFNDAIQIYQRGVNCCPEDADLICILNSNIAICYMKMNDLEQTIQYSKKAVEKNPKYRKAWINLGNAYNQSDKPEQALDAYKKAEDIESDPTLKPIIGRLTKKVDQINQQRKQQVMSGLKNIGNSVLGWFGMSLDNFKINKNPDGTYGVSTQQ